MAFDIQSLLQMLQNQYQQANTAGLERYNSLMQGVNTAKSDITGSYNRAMGLTDTMGSTAKARIGEDTLRQKGSAAQDLTSRGLGNTTITSSVNRGIDADAARNTADVNERVNTAKSGLEMSRAGSQLDVARLMADATLSRQDQGPDMGMFANLLQTLSANNNGVTGGGGGGRSTNVIGGHPSGTPGGANFFASSGGGGSGDSGVQTFRNDAAAVNAPFQIGSGGQGAWYDPLRMEMVPGRPGFARMKPQFIQQSSTGPVSYSGTTPQR